MSGKAKLTLQKFHLLQSWRDYTCYKERHNCQYFANYLWQESRKTEKNVFGLIQSRDHQINWGIIWITFISFALSQDRNKRIGPKSNGRRGRKGTVLASQPSLHGRWNWQKPLQKHTLPVYFITWVFTWGLLFHMEHNTCNRYAKDTESSTWAGDFMHWRLSHKLFRKGEGGMLTSYDWVSCFLRI